jgi:hypothetical protein
LNFLNFIYNFKLTLTSKEEKMFVSNHTFIVNKPEKIMESFEIIANLWIKFGAKSCRLMDLGGSGIGKMAFISVFDNMQQYGSCMDKLVESEEYKNWSNETNGDATFTGHRLERQIAMIES